MQNKTLGPQIKSSTTGAPLHVFPQDIPSNPGTTLSGITLSPPHDQIDAQTRIYASLLESRFFLWVRKPTEKFEYRQKITHRNRMTEKSTFSVGSPSETIFLWVSHAQKNYVRPD